METFLEKFNDIIDAEEDVKIDAVLRDIDEWDSLSVISFIAMANVSYGKKLSLANVRKAIIVKDLYELVK